MFTFKEYNQSLEEAKVIQFPKKEKTKAPAKPVHCPKCGGEMQSGKMDGHSVKVCVPCLTYVKEEDQTSELTK